VEFVVVVLMMMMMMMDRTGLDYHPPYVPKFVEWTVSAALAY
jgi:hypothetical protein